MVEHSSWHVVALELASCLKTVGSWKGASTSWMMLGVMMNHRGCRIAVSVQLYGHGCVFHART
jgi:hypothetical protein